MSWPLLQWIDVSFPPSRAVLKLNPAAASLAVAPHASLPIGSSYAQRTGTGKRRTTKQKKAQIRKREEKEFKGPVEGGSSAARGRSGVEGLGFWKRVARGYGH